MNSVRPDISILIVMSHYICFLNETSSFFVLCAICGAFYRKGWLNRQYVTRTHVRIWEETWQLNNTCMIIFFE